MTTLVCLDCYGTGVRTLRGRIVDACGACADRAELQWIALLGVMARHRQRTNLNERRNPIDYPRRRVDGDAAGLHAELLW